MLFPCLVTLSTGETFTVCRTYSTPEGGTDVWWWDAVQNAAVVVAHGPGFPEASPTAPHHWSLVLDDSDILAEIVHTPGDCGCGHPMKRFRPVTPMREYAPPSG